jgi:fumarylpyruvate hydrolase
MTRRDLQRALGDEKKPWEIGKSFDMSAPIGPIHRVEQVGHFKAQNISLAVNGTIKQNATLAHMIWSVAEQIARLSTAFELKAGDIIYSGTPENVGPVVRGDVIVCKLDGLPDLSAHSAGLLFWRISKAVTVCLFFEAKRRKKLTVSVLRDE